MPKGSLAKNWNLLVWACGDCNAKKADLEDDISSITLVGKASELGSADDLDLQDEAQRKANRSISRRTGKRVVQSVESIKINQNGPIVNISADFVGPPQLDHDRACELAKMQLQAFFYFLTFDHTKKSGNWWRGNLFALDLTNKQDFGNNVQRAFAKSVLDWDYRLLVTTAMGYFRTAIRKHPDGDAWSFAIEWNDNYRLIGYFGNDLLCSSELGRIPKLKPDSIFRDGASTFAIRRGMPLTEAEDLLFRGPDDEA